MSAGFPMSQRDTAYQPRATPWAGMHGPVGAIFDSYSPSPMP